MSKKILGFVFAFCLGLISWLCITNFFEMTKTKVLENSSEAGNIPPQIPVFQDSSTPAQNEFKRDNMVEEEEIWVPSDVEECLSKVNVGEPIKVAAYFNPYY